MLQRFLSSVKCSGFSNMLILRDLQSGVHFSLLYKKLRNADRFSIA